MDRLRQKQTEETPELYRRLTEIVDRFWATARSAHAEVLRGDRVYADAVSLRVFDSEIQRSRIRRALEIIFQVEFADGALAWTGRSPSAGTTEFVLTEPFPIVLRMSRRVMTAAEPLDEHGGLGGVNTYSTYEHFYLVSYDKDAWQTYLAEAEDHMGHTSMRDLLARCPDRDSVADMVSAILIAATERPRRTKRDDTPTRQFRGIHLRAKRSKGTN